jgi:hypothetical protein
MLNITFFSATWLIVQFAVIAAIALLCAGCSLQAYKKGKAAGKKELLDEVKKEAGENNRIRSPEYPIEQPFKFSPHYMLTALCIVVSYFLMTYAFLFAVQR